MVPESGKAKIDENRFTTVPDDNVVWLDVLVDDADDPVAVVHRLEHIDEEETCLPDLDAFRQGVVEAALLPALLVVLFVFSVDAVEHVAEAAIRAVVGYEVDISTDGRVIDDLMQPD